MPARRVIQNAVFSALCIGLVSAQVPACDPTSPLTPPLICDLRSGFGGSLVNPQVIPTFLPVGLLNVQYGPLSIASAMQLPPTRVNFPPTLQFNQTAGTPATGPKYILAMVDPDAPTPQNPTQANLLQWMATDLEVDAKTLTLGGGTIVASYADPNPPAGSDPHRFVFLLWTQPANFTLPATLHNLPATVTGARSNFNLSAFVAAAGLGGPVSGNFFKSAFNTGGADGTTQGATADPLSNVVTPTAGGPVTGKSAPTRFANRRRRAFRV